MKLNWDSLRLLSWRALQLAALLAMMAAGSYWYLAAIPVIEHRIENGDLVAEVMGTGTLEARVKSTISPKIAGRIHEILVDQGDQVRSCACHTGSPSNTACDSPQNDASPVSDRAWRQKSSSDTDCQKWRRRESNGDAAFPISLSDNNLHEAPPTLVAPRHRVGVSEGHPPSSIDSLGELPNDLRRIVQAWHSLNPKTRAAILLLIEPL